IAAVAELHPTVVCAMKNERRDMDARQEIADVDLRVHREQVSSHAGAGGCSKVACPRSSVAPVDRRAWISDVPPVSCRPGLIEAVEEDLQFVVTDSPWIVLG